MVIMAHPKELYIGKCMEDLEVHLNIPDVKPQKTSNLLQTAHKLLKEAEKYYKDGDEELAYIFYMRYFNLLDCINHKPDYSQYKDKARQIIGGNKANKLIMDKLENVSNSLKVRYEGINANGNSNARIELPTLPTPPSNVLYHNREYDLLSASEKFDLLKAETVESNLTKNEFNLKEFNRIGCKDLFERMKESSVLIMDCRPKADYNNSLLLYQWAFNVPEECIMAGMSAGKLQDKLDKENKILWSARTVKNYVVLMDWNTKDHNPSHNSPISILMDILKNWDPDVTYRSPIKILDGGYEYFITMYPTLCTNPSVQAPPQERIEINLIDDIEYPSINDITMKDDVIPTISNLPTRPSIDRASKQAALNTYSGKQKPIEEILKEQEILHEKAQVNDVQLQQAEEKFDMILELKQKSVDNNVELTVEEQRLLYNIMQLESTAEDYKIENIRLRDELDKYKNLEKEQQEKLSSNEKEKIEETTRRIENKIQEREKLDEKLEFERKQRQKQLADARETKRHMKPPVIEDEEISKPKIPQFDRSIKPYNAIPAASTTITTERRRDFSPVPGNMGRGLTGLKNLGNTCYMNSILQCLSHTPQLTEYCITDKYKQYISRKNKTKGQIVEEVAALIKVLWNGNYKCVASKDLRFVIGQYQQIFRGIEQQDSHEFLTILMDWLHSDLQTLPNKPRDNMTASEKAWFEFTKSRESLILHLFYGQIKSTIKCKTCEKESATYESFSNLSLELPSNGTACYLSQCMDLYFNGEVITDWNCPSCKEKREAIKKLDISKLPPVLIIHFKRFYADQTSSICNSYKKKQNYVFFPLENLEMTPYIAKSELRSVSPKTYQLYGVSNHYGTMESGHYTAFCKSSNYDRWYKFDDQVVTSLDKTNVVSSAAYILFYTWLPPIQISESK